MNRKNGWIVSLFIIGLLSLVVVEGFINPKIAADQRQYEAGQNSPLTHDFTALAQYENAYMGNFSNLSHLNQSLPLHKQLDGYQLFPETLTAQINYSLNTDKMDAVQLDRILVYNALANFVLIDNLEQIVYQFKDTQVVFERKLAEQWAGTELRTLQNSERWDSIVRQKLVEPAEVRAVFSQIVDNS
ncbi:DUF4825 domain-containing protein [Paenibacillus polysaccharolyticus]|uniref:DUF4825 domain-containing protein n=1 Tax=Paenibacillus polysaccharolyticus TaxID=582692 RepID=UPI00203D6ECF|nr:DUF4825 domain-containing protein [Paenibacillus polysaccharolyticus]MCM3134135.1 DUF4825 domain-containing protein [Paenibacillus polysaccharolyticus]